MLDEPYADISTQTMLPTAHLLWSSVWLGIASDAVDLARRFVQGEARRKPGTTPPAALRLAEVTVVHQQFIDMVQSSLARYEAADTTRPPVVDRLRRRDERPQGVAPPPWSSTSSASACSSAASPPTASTPRTRLGRHLRDAMGAALMVNNDRIMANNAQMLLVLRGE